MEYQITDWYENWNTQMELDDELLEDRVENNHYGYSIMLRQGSVLALIRFVTYITSISMVNDSSYINLMQMMLKYHIQ